MKQVRYLKKQLKNNISVTKFSKIFKKNDDKWKKIKFKNKIGAVLTSLKYEEMYDIY